MPQIPLHSAASLDEKLTAAEELLLKQPQLECKVNHHFGPGLYIREVTFPEGSFVLGHEHKEDHLNIMLSGEVTLLLPEGQTEHVTAPAIFVATPGRKAAIVHKTCVWLNIHPNPDNETNIDVLEKRWVKLSPAYQQHQEQLKQETPELL